MTIAKVLHLENLIGLMCATYQRCYAAVVLCCLLISRHQRDLNALQSSKHDAAHMQRRLDASAPTQRAASMEDERFYMNAE